MKKTDIDRELRRKAEEKVASQPSSTGETDVKHLLHKQNNHSSSVQGHLTHKFANRLLAADRRSAARGAAVLLKASSYIMGGTR